MSSMLLHLTATLFQALFPALQEAGFLNVPHKLVLVIGVPKWRRFFIALSSNQFFFRRYPFKIMYFCIGKQNEIRYRHLKHLISLK